MLKRTTIGAMLLLGSWGWSSAMATITFTTDSASQLTGSFSALSGADPESASSTVFGGSANQLLPGGINLLQLGRLEFDTTRLFLFQSWGQGTPESPRFSFSASLDDAPRTFADVSGIYNNNPSSTSVYFLFSNLADSGGASGSFSGNFTFSTIPLSPIPEPEIYAMMMAGLGLVGLVVRKKKLRSSVTEGDSRKKVDV